MSFVSTTFSNCQVLVTEVYTINIEKRTFLYLDPNLDLNYRVLLDTVHFIVMELRIT